MSGARALDRGRVMQVTKRAPAKVNLSLLVGPTDPSGYHELFTVFVPVDVYDVLGFALEAKPTQRQPGPGAREGPRHRGGGEHRRSRPAARWSATPAGSSPGRVTIDKGIPMAAGMGGGSTDAAMALQVGAQVLREAGGTGAERRRTAQAGSGAGRRRALLPGSADRRSARGIGELLEPLALPELPAGADLHRPAALHRPRVPGVRRSRTSPRAAPISRSLTRPRRRWRQVQTVADVAELLAERPGGDQLQPAARALRREGHACCRRGRWARS